MREHDQHESVVGALASHRLGSSGLSLESKIVSISFFGRESKDARSGDRRGDARRPHSRVHSISMPPHFVVRRCQSLTRNNDLRVDPGRFS